MVNIREKQFLQQDAKLYEREIRTLYAKFDKELGLSGAKLPIVFSFEEDVLGAYTPKSEGQREQFTFSLFFIGYCNKNPMHRLDKIDLYAHEYAHYMQYHYEIPEKYMFSPGKHGSAWKYCCSLVGAAPTEFYRIGEGLKKHNYDKALYNPLADKNYVLLDQRKQEQKYRANRDSQERFRIGETIEHPKYGIGIVEDVIAQAASVRLKIRFGDELKTIDQKWLLKETKYKK